MDIPYRKLCNSALCSRLPSENCLISKWLLKSQGEIQKTRQNFHNPQRQKIKSQFQGHSVYFYSGKCGQKVENSAKYHRCTEFCIKIQPSCSLKFLQYWNVKFNAYLIYIYCQLTFFLQSSGGKTN